MPGTFGLCARRMFLSLPRRAGSIYHQSDVPQSIVGMRRYHRQALHDHSVERRQPAAFRTHARLQSNSAGTNTTKYSFDDLRAQLAPVEVGGPDPRPAPLLLIDVREPGELQATGRIPTAQNMPISSVPEGAFLPPDEFEDRFGFPKPTAGDEVVFYCKSGVRSRAAAQMVADSWSRDGIKVSEFPGSWTEWEGRGGEVEK